jgi:hypothetical protein
MYLKALIVVFLGYLCVLEHKKLYGDHVYKITSSYGGIKRTDFIITNHLLNKIWSMEKKWNRNVPNTSATYVIDAKKIH